MVLQRPIFKFVLPPFILNSSHLISTVKEEFNYSALTFCAQEQRREHQEPKEMEMRIRKKIAIQRLDIKSREDVLKLMQNT